ncbi:hypothetical protein [Streptomyces sp. Y7]|uniref:hypothetical protein n=1 Tax=Streptomyces sp. Y7 TaxID=3342392 RepID=UPI003715BB5F
MGGESQFSGVHPALLSIYEEYSKSLTLTDDAEATIVDLLKKVTKRIQNTPEAERSTLIEDAKEALMKASGAFEYRARIRGAAKMDNESVTSVMQSLCPLPPLCYRTKATQKEPQM